MTINKSAIQADRSGGDRSLALEVVDRMRHVLVPLHGQVEQSLVEGVTDVKVNVTQLISQLETRVIVQKADHVRQALDQEEQMLDYVRTHHIDDGCIDLIYELIDDDMDIAGYGISNCLVSRVADGVQKEIDALRADGLWPEYRWLNVSLFEVFENGNVISDPAVLLTRLDEKQEILEDDSVLDFLPEMEQNIELFQQRLATIETAYAQCLQINLSTLNMAFEIVKMQITQICY
ncbi:uncharacterized protein LOC128270933 [Anopheles cruzii]|uniref:uncharacterized protein LOC128270933 n=1 Tax=Anopheles cruzii TaxID=68878 RepID=UPI0022EC8FFA|nr:uncharacterized protein LOC128270933 [Anopheles cruzii]